MGVAMKSDRFFSNPNNNHLDWQDRSTLLKERIELAWKNITQHTSSVNWSQNGRSTYSIMDYSEIRLLKKIIVDHYPERKEFYFLDIGSGEFQLVTRLFSLLNEDSTIPQDIKIHLIGIRGEKSSNGTELEKIESGICIQYNFCFFQIENLIEEFTKHHLDLRQKIDVIVTRWTLRHLVDPLGTYLQAYELLRENGFLLFDGFFFLVDNPTAPTYNADREDNEQFLDIMVSQMHQLASQGGNSFLIYPTNKDSVLHEFLVKKSGSESLKLNLNYVEKGLVDYATLRQDH